MKVPITIDSASQPQPLNEPVADTELLRRQSKITFETSIKLPFKIECKPLTIVEATYDTPISKLPKPKLIVRTTIKYNWTDGEVKD